MGKCCKVAGWGKLKFDNHARTNELQEVKVPIMDLESCKKGYKDGKDDAYITKDNFCAGLLNRDSCKVSTN